MAVDGGWGCTEAVGGEMECSVAVGSVNGFRIAVGGVRECRVLVGGVRECRVVVGGEWWPIELHGCMGCMVVAVGVRGHVVVIRGTCKGGSRRP